MADLEGKNLDRYELRQLRGRGGMADVYLAYDPHFEREVAVKVFKREDEDLLRRFIREAQLMASLHNAHLMPVYDTGTCRLDGMNVYYIVMPFMDGGTLRARIRRAPVPLKQACHYLRDIADALDYMHGQGIIHRDIKSSNVLLDADGRCYLADFGIARTASDSTQLTSTGNVLGTVDYIAPELFESNYRADERSDYYSLGVLLYEMVTGHLPFVAENQIAVVAMHVNKLPPPPRTYVPNLSPAVENVMLRALEKQPDARYGSAAELATAFCRASTARPTAKLPAAGVQNQPSGAFSSSTRRQAVPPPASYPPAPRPTPAIAAPVDGYYGEAPGRYAAQASLYPPPDLQKNHPAHTQGWIVTMIAIIILLIIAIPVSYAVMKTINRPVAVSTSVPPTATPDLQSTAQASTAMAVQQANGSATAQAQSTATVQAKASATATAKKQATATAQAQSTATVQAKASATAGVIQTATAANPLYTDALNNQDDANTQSAQWDTNMTTCSFHDDGYHVTSNQLNTFVGCHEAGKQFQNFTAQVDMSIQSGHSGGLLFRMDVGPLKGYLFEVDDKGNYKISVSKNYDLGSMTVLRDWTASPDLKTGTNKNRLQVIARDGTLLFYINGMYQPAPIEDATLSGGDIGFLAASDKGEKTTVVYSNVSVYPLS